MTTFDNALALILKHEGGYVNDLRDAGGETNYGISKRAYPNVDIKKLTPALAGELYRKDYWDAVQGDKLPPVLALCAFDCAVNQGPDYARKNLQFALGVKMDGSIGQVTLAAAAKRPYDTAIKYQAARIERYVKTAGFDTFGSGWIRRTIETSMAASRL